VSGPRPPGGHGRAAGEESAAPTPTADDTARASADATGRPGAQATGRPGGDAAPSLATALIHHPYQPPPNFGAVPTAVHKASTVLFADTAALRRRNWRDKSSGYTYGLGGTPTSYVLEERIATLEGAHHALLLPSGLAAIALVDFALLGQGDEVLLPDNVYGPSRELARHELAQFGIAHRLYDPMDAASLAAAIGPRTRLAWIEAPGSVTMEFPDVRSLAAVCRERGVTSALDNTWGSGIAFAPFELGVDLSMQALTKYASGGADVLMGAVTTRDASLHQRLLAARTRLGHGLGGNDLELVLRALPSLPLRYAAQDAAARRLAAWWQERSEAARVLHPALAGSPGHEHWASQCRAAAGLFSVVFDERFDTRRVDAFVDALRLFGIGYSWAGPMSLAVPYDLRTLRGAGAGVLVRFSVGLEAVEDLIADCEQALGALQG
jgi:cystathionine beta-lyase